MLVLTFGFAKCQISDFNLMLKGPKQDTTKILQKRNVSYTFKDKKWIAKYNPVSLFWGYTLYFYQKVISPQIVMGCVFNPSCSNFSKACIHQFGLIKGIFLSTDRLTRCTRLSSIDFHPIMFDKDNKVNDLPEYYSVKKNK
jgi:putative component of membrane protein insertase Oxa1/YidC/SpoIIIJ protein YidD